LRGEGADLPGAQGSEEVLQIAAVVAQRVGGEVAGRTALRKVALKEICRDLVEFSSFDGRRTDRPAGLWLRRAGLQAGMPSRLVSPVNVRRNGVTGTAARISAPIG
jgi:hypothetical protein